MKKRVRNPLCSDGEKLVAKLETLIKTHLSELFDVFIGIIALYYICQTNSFQN